MGAYHDYEDRLKERAISTFLTHQIASRTDNSIVIRRRYDDGSWRSEYSAEIIASSLNHLIVTGDIATVVFAHSGIQHREISVFPL